MSKDRPCQMERKATEKEEAGVDRQRQSGVQSALEIKNGWNSQERYPPEILVQATQQRIDSQAVFQHGYPNITSSREHHRASQPDLPRAEKVAVDVEGQAEKNVVEYREEHRSGDAII